MKKIFVQLTIFVVIIANQAFAMEPLEQGDADSVTIQIANQSKYPVLVFRAKNGLLAEAREGRAIIRGPYFDDSAYYERMFMTAETDSEPFVLDSKHDLYIAFAHGLYEINNSYEMRFTGNIVRTNLNTYNSLRYPSQVSKLKNARKIIVIIDPNGELQLIKQQ